MTSFYYVSDMIALRWFCFQMYSTFFRASQMLLEWEGFRRLYMFVMTENLRGIIRRWQKELFPEYLKTQLGE